MSPELLNGDGYGRKTDVWWVGGEGVVYVVIRGCGFGLNVTSKTHPHNYISNQLLP